MNKMKMVVALGAVMITGLTFAGPRGCGGGGWCRPVHPCRPCHPHWHGDRGWWGRGGRNFWPGFAGGVVGGIIGSAISSPTVVAAPPTVVTTPTVVTPTVVAAPTVVTTPAVVTPTVVTTPVATTQNVWVNGCYVDQVQANGSVIRVWQPGHYEQRTITVQ